MATRRPRAQLPVNNHFPSLIQSELISHRRSRQVVQSLSLLSDILRCNYKSGMFVNYMFATGGVKLLSFLALN